jgi:hypothetical protein
VSTDANTGPFGNVCSTINYSTVLRAISAFSQASSMRLSKLGEFSAQILGVSVTNRSGSLVSSLPDPFVPFCLSNSDVFPIDIYRTVPCNRTNIVVCVADYLGEDFKNRTFLFLPGF